MRLSLNNEILRKIIYGTLAILISALAAVIIRVKNSARSELAKERSRHESYLPFERTKLIPHSKNNVQIWQNVDDTRDFVKFQDSYFAATSGGLVQLAADGNLIRHFTVLDGLSESDLTNLIVFNAKLFIGTRSQGLLVFDGENFESYKFTDRDAQAITAFLIDDGRALIGTFVVNPNAIYSDGARLFVGTLEGVKILDLNTQKWSVLSENLPSKVVISITGNDENIYFGTTNGIARIKKSYFAKGDF